MADKVGFFSKYEAPEREDSLSGDEKDVLVESATVVAITKVNGPVETKNGQAFMVDFEIEGETKLGIFSQGSVFTRDHLLLAIQDELEAGGDPVEVVFRKAGRAYLLEDPNAPAGE